MNIPQAVIDLMQSIGIIACVVSVVILAMRGLR